MRVVLPLVAKRSVAQVAEALREDVAALDLDGLDEVQERLFAMLRFVEEALPEHLRPLLAPLALHECYVSAHYLEAMAKRVDAAWTREQIDAFTASLTAAGLLQDRGQAIYEVHPVLTDFLRSQASDAEGDEAWVQAFVQVMAILADRAAPKPLHEQRSTFFVYGAGFHQARQEAERLKMLEHESALIQSLAAYARNVRDFDEEATGYAALAAIQERLGDERGVAITYHQLGIVTQERRAFDEVEAWYRKSLAVKERLGDDLGAAATHHQLGCIAVVAA